MVCGVGYCAPNNDQRQKRTTADNNGERHGGPHWELTKRIIAAFYTVKQELGSGFPEYVYANAVSTILREMGLHVLREVPFEVVFHGVIVGICRADLVVEGIVLVETKVARGIAAAHREQLRHYLLASKLNVGLILNFGDNPGTGRVVVP